MELGCGISGLMALTLAPCVRHYVATDQEYVQRLMRANLETNAAASSSASRTPSAKSKGRKQTQPSKRTKSSKPSSPPPTPANITVTTLDWETDIPGSLKDSIELDDDPDGEDKGFDLIVSCDCIYNEALVAPFVRTCADLCRLRPVYREIGGGGDGGGNNPRPPTMCLIAQQQRSPDVFETWLRETMRYFRVWRVSDEVAGEKLRLGSGYLVHLLLLREDAAGAV